MSGRGFSIYSINWPALLSFVVFMLSLSGTVFGAAICYISTGSGPLGFVAWFALMGCVFVDRKMARGEL